MYSPRNVVLAVLLCLLALPGRAAQISLALGTIRHPAFEAESVTLAFDAQRRGEGEIRLGRVRVAGVEYRELQLRCSDFYFDGGNLDCPAGTLRRADERGRDRPPLPFTLAFRARDGYLKFALADIDAVALSPLVKRLRGWKPTGRVDLQIEMKGDKADLSLALRELNFANKDASVAGTDVAATLRAHGERRGNSWEWNAAIDWAQGALTWLPWHFPSGVRVSAQGRFDDAELDVRQARLEVAGIGAVNASMRWDRERDVPIAWGFVTEQLDLATAMREGVQPWLAQLGFPQWRLSGKALFSADWHDGRLQRFYAGLEDASLSDPTGYIELSGVNARIPWEKASATQADVSVASGRFGELPFSNFSFPIDLAGRAGRMTNVVAPMLDGRFEIEKLVLENDDDGWRAAFAGGIDGISMPKLTRLLRLPIMAGNLTMRVPEIAYAKDALALKGAIGIEVFDGGLIVHRLRVVDPFGSRRRFIADVTARNLDLGMLTRTFSFGSIEGRFDADLHDLEMEGLKPVQFDARIRSSEGDYPRSVSLGALRDIAELGEENPASLTRMPERTSGGFGYARIDVGCKLKDGTCLLDGIRREGDGIVLMEGRGVPSVRIIGYNPRIDWEALVARIREKTAGKPGVIIE